MKGISRREFLKRAGVAFAVGGQIWISLAETRGETRRNQVVKKRVALMGTVIEITAVAKRRVTAERAVSEALGEMQRIERVMSVFDPQSELSRINALAAERPVQTTEEVFSLLEKAVEVSRISEGAFDITVLPLMHLWGFMKKDGRVPAEEEISEILPQVNYRHLLLNRSERSVTFRWPGVGIDLGGIAKGHAVDRALSVMLNLDIEGALIKAGGDLCSVGTKEEGMPWVIGIQHPREKDQIIAALEIEKGAVSTSGDYERYFIVDGKRYCHIIDPRTGHPVQGVAGATVLAPTAVEADGFSTAIFTLGSQKGMALIEEQKKTEGMILTDRLEKTISAGFQSRLIAI